MKKFLFGSRAEAAASAEKDLREEIEKEMAAAAEKQQQEAAAAEKQQIDQTSYTRGFVEGIKNEPSANEQLDRVRGQLVWAQAVQQQPTQQLDQVSFVNGFTDGIKAKTQPAQQADLAQIVQALAVQQPAQQPAAPAQPAADPLTQQLAQALAIQSLAVQAQPAQQPVTPAAQPAPNVSGQGIFINGVFWGDYSPENLEAVFQTAYSLGEENNTVLAYYFTAGGQHVQLTAVKTLEQLVNERPPESRPSPFVYPDGEHKIVFVNSKTKPQRFVCKGATDFLAKNRNEAKRFTSFEMKAEKNKFIYLGQFVKGT